MKITVVTVAWNSAATIEDTLRSVAAQVTRHDIEHLIIDGGSTDGTMDIVARFPHVAKAISERDGGIYNAMNKGLRLATGDAVGFLNSDDFFSRTDAIELIGNGLESSGADAVTGAVAMIDRNDSKIVRRAYGSVGYRPWMLRFGHMPPHPTLYARRDAMRAIGEFDERLRTSADFDIVVRLYKAKARFHQLAATLVGFRDGGNSTQGLASTVKINRDLHASLKKNGMLASFPLLYSRYPIKAFQYVARARDYEVPAFLDKAKPS